MENENTAVTFSIIDYGMFCAMLCVSILIGIYYGCFGSKQSTTEDYLFGGKSMRSFPVALSLVASYLSGISLLGMPSEVYFHGTQMIACVVSIIFTILVTIYVFLPVFLNLQLNSTYEYLKIRFDHRVRTLASILFVISSLLYIPIIIYVPSLAFNQVTGISIWIICPIICTVCIFYTTIGGLKAVVLTDAIQFSITASTLVLIVVLGTYRAGGIQPVWQRAEVGERLEFFNINPDPTERTTLWGILFGVATMWISHIGLSPSSVQRFQAMPDPKTVKRCLVFFCVGTMITKIVIVFIGLLMYHEYHDCDPLQAGFIKRFDQMLPVYAMSLLGHIRGITGVFIAGVVCTAFSSMSTCLNTLSGTIYQDFIASRMPKDTSESTVNTIMKTIVVLIGIVSLAFVYVVENLGGVMELSLNFRGITEGPLMGLFVLGMLFRRANTKGALWGGIASTIIQMFLVFGKQLFFITKSLEVEKRPSSVENCGKYNITIDFNATTNPPPINDVDKPWFIFSISFYYSTLIGMILTVSIALLVSKLTRNDRLPGPELLSPCLYWFDSKKTSKSCGEDYHTVQEALQKLQIEKLSIEVEKTT